MLQSNLSNIKHATRFKKVFYPENEDPMIRYEKVLEVQYTALADGETSVIIPALIGAIRITQIEKEIKPMSTADFSFNPTNGQVNLLNSVSLSAGESLFILYAVLVTS